MEYQQTELGRRSVPRPDIFEQLLNLVLGPDDSARPLPEPLAGGLAEALELAILPALQRSPCVVSFSGGRDSSLVLALATDVARRHGLELPIPVTMRFAGAPDTEEADWQRLVLDHLGLRNQEIIRLGQELDALGEDATETLRAHGLLWPANAYTHAPIMRLARGGALLTGVGGDEMLSMQPVEATARRRLLSLVPVPLRAAIWQRLRPWAAPPWATMAGAAQAGRLWARDEVREQLPLRRSLEQWYASRSYAALDGSLRLVGSGHGVEVINPLLNGQTVAQFADLIGTGVFVGRAATTRLVAGGLLPEAVVARRSKAVFSVPLWGPNARAFIDGWAGGYHDPRYVDDAALHAELSQALPSFATVPLLHSAWLSEHQNEPAPE